jgi:hypothetical protein
MHHAMQVGDPTTALQVKEVVGTWGIDLVIGIHAYRAGRLLEQIDRPYLLILGGTDANEFIHEFKYVKVMAMAMQVGSVSISP